jgi:nitrogen fixation/metabolism regulation signal transduction histidine kinase
LKAADDGLTLSPEQLTRVWTPYYQGEKYFTGEAAGMGLGLPTVASLIWEVGGTCRLYNRNDSPGVVVELAIPIDLR